MKLFAWLFNQPGWVILVALILGALLAFLSSSTFLVLLPYMLAGLVTYGLFILLIRQIERPLIKVALKRRAGWLGFVAVLETTVLCFPFLALLAPYVLFFHGWVILISAIRKRRDIVLNRLAAMGLLLVFAGISGGMQWLDFHFAQERALTLSDAIERYYENEGQYPSSLDDLTPRYLEELPRARYGAFCRMDLGGRKGFTYHPPMSGPGPILFFIQFPPFGRQNYDFKERRWRFID